MPTQWPSRIDGTVEADELIVGQGVVVEPGVVISGKGGRCRRVVLGDFCYVGRETRILVPEFVLGDYSKLNAYSFAHGTNPLRIGRNCWIGGNVVLDSIGGLDVDDGVGIGAHSQVWTHIQFGDVVQGCRFHSHRYMHVGREAWFVGHCIVSPVEVGARSMAMAGSVVTRPMLPDRTYAGVPARDVTDALGPQFDSPTAEWKREKLRSLIRDYESLHPGHEGLLVVAGPGPLPDPVPGRTVFDVETRTYTRTYSEAEVGFLRANVPLVKFTPAGAGPAYVPCPPADG
jgi:acetyltransferase-like isoleucine patch superfamily enzyme